MGIQQRLLKARYTEYNLHMPSRKERITFKETLTRRRGLRDKLAKTQKEFLNIFINPTIKDRWTKTYLIVPTDFKEELGYGKALQTIVNDTAFLLYRWLYDKEFQERYHSNYELFSIVLVSHILFSMRKSIMRRLRTAGKIPMIHDFCNTQSHGYYNFPKPMTNKCSVHQGIRILRLLEPMIEEHHLS